VELLPELPEVETTRRGIEPFLENEVIESVEVRNGHLRWPVSNEICKLESQKVYQILRRGKYIILELDTGAILIHLGMSGSMRIEEPDSELKKHDHVIFYLSSEKQIRFNDPRRFGSILWSNCWHEHTLINKLGPEPLSEEFNADYLYRIAKKRKQTIKQFIMNSQVVVGVGNIYANEALYMAGIHPLRKANQISLKCMQIFVEKIKLVLLNAIQQGGTSLRDFVGSDGKPGYFKQQLFVYGRGGLECSCCAQELVEIRINNRTTVFCKKCQA
jgi:formamidopyrimidine-DNA glycosylase